jgi:outer membrane protein
VGLSLNFPIFQQFDIETAVELAQVNYKNTEEDLLALERQIKIEVKQAYQLLVAAKKALNVAIKNVISTEENRRVNNERYSLGSGTILDVLQSDRDYQDALSARINAEFVFYKSRDGLLNAIGKLDFNQYE